MKTQTPTNQPEHDRPVGQPRPPGTNGLYLVVIIGAGLTLAALLVIVFLNRGDDSGSGGFEPTATTQAAATSEPTATDSSQPSTTANAATSGTGQTTASTAAPSTTTSNTTNGSTPPTAAQPVVWPAPGSETRFATPVEAARSFAIDLAGFDDPVLGEFQAGDGRSGEIELQPVATGPVSTILLRQVGPDDSWSVIAVVNDNIVISQPTAGATVANPMILAGQARAFEGHVDVKVYAHGRTGPIASGFVTGRGDGVLGDFDSTVDWPSTTPDTGILMLSTSSAEDGSMWDVAAVPVRFS